VALATERQTAFGAWSHVYAGMEEASPYGGFGSYELGAEWLSSCSLVTDWGCGKGWLRTLVEDERYRGIDGSASPFADEEVDLAEYRSSSSGVFMLQVLEHDWRWAQILDNALASFTERMALILFSPLGDETREVGRESMAAVPVIGFRLQDITERFDCDYEIRYLKAERNAFFDAVFDETVILAQR
jgi:hypothetical protein